MRKPSLQAVVSAGLLLMATVAAAAPPGLGEAVEAIEGVHRLLEPGVSPDGRWASWVEGGSVGSSLRLLDLRSPPLRARTLTAREDDTLVREYGVAWSPDSRRLVFLSEASEHGQLQLFISPVERPGPRVVTHLKGHLANPRFSPDGREVALLMVEGTSADTGALHAHARDRGVVRDTVGSQRIAVVDLSSGQTRFASPAGLYVYDFDWSPDGASFAAEATSGSGTNDYWVSELYLVDAKSGSARSIFKPELQIACPRFSPDGSSIALIHGLMSDEGSTGGDIVLVPVKGGEAKNLTPSLPASVAWLEWRRGGEILFEETIDGETALVLLDARKGTSQVLWRAAESLSGLALSKDGLVSVTVRESFTSAPEVGVGRIGSWQSVTSVNASLHPLWGEARSLHTQASDAVRSQAWLLPPRNVDPSKTYPLVVDVHGGPSAAHKPGWPKRFPALLASLGYYVLLPNPRGSYGGGEAFTRANVKDFGYGDFKDILAAVDESLKTNSVDPHRLGIIGWSYGGYMTMWAVTQTERFKAAVAGAGIANWQSYYGENRIDRWMIPFFGASVYDDPAIYARSSPLTFIRNVKTPTLVLQGERDSEVPAPQAYEFWHALKTLGVPTELVVYPDEGHSFTKSDDRRDVLRRTAEWFSKYL